MALSDAKYVLAHADWRTPIERTLARAYLDLVEQLEPMRGALATADREACVAYDALYDKSVEGNSRLHDNEDELSAESAIWRLRHTVRPFLADSSPATEPHKEHWDVVYPTD